MHCGSSHPQSKTICQQKLLILKSIIKYYNGIMKREKDWGQVTRYSYYYKVLHTTKALTR